MPERDYFSLRYAVPGFVFILIVFGTNYSVVLSIIARQGAKDALSISVAILSLFASSAIGFLISQSWFFYFHKKRIYADILRKPKQEIEKSMKDSFGWRLKPEDKKDEKKDKKEERKRDEIMGTAIDYALNSFSSENNDLFKFFQRKIDLYHTMSCTLFSLYIGLGLGLSTRGIWFCRILRWPFDAFLDFFLFLFTIGAVLIFIYVLRYLRSEIFFEYHPMLKLFLNSIKDEEKINKNLHEVYGEYVDKQSKNPRQNPS
jgi:hypothetical protein